MSKILRVEIPRDAHAPTEARAAVASLAGRVDPSFVPDATLLVSELVTNSVKYGGGGTVTVEVTSDGPSAMHVEVIDRGVGFVPVARTKPDTEVGGWGLYLVDALSDQWGVHEGSTHVWFDISSRDSR